MTLASPISGVDSAGFVIVMDGGVDEESDDQLRARVLLRIREPPMGGAAIDYEHGRCRFPASPARGATRWKWAWAR